MADYVLGLDFGTSAIHCLLVDERNRAVAQAEGPVEYFCPEGGPPLAREFDPEEVWATVGKLVRQVSRMAQVSAGQVSAIGVTSQGQGTVLLGGPDRELYCGPNIDLRSVFEGAAIDEEAGSEIYRTTGHFPAMLMAPARLRWLNSHQPGAAETASTVLSIAGWLVWRMTGQAVGAHGLDCGLGISAVDVSESAAPLLRRIGFPMELAPQLVRAGDPSAGLTSPTATDWGLCEGTPVTLADADNLAGLLGMGLTAPGETGLLMGWSGSVQVLTESAEFDGAPPRTWVDPYPVGGLHTVQANLGDVGRAYEWLLRTICGGLSYAEAEELAAQVPAGSEGAVSFLGPGPVTAPSAGLRLGGIVFPTPMSFQEPTTGQIIRSYLESVAYSVRANLETASGASGPSASRVYLGGSLGCSGVLAETISSLLEVPVHRSANPQVSALGAATAAWVAAGRHRDLYEAVGTQRGEFHVFPPAPSRSVEYRQHYQRWLEIYEQLSAPR